MIDCICNIQLDMDEGCDVNMEMDDGDEYNLNVSGVKSVNGKVGKVVLDAGDFAYDDTKEYSAGSVGAELKELSQKEIDVDSALSDTSTNPVQNKVVNAKTTDVEHDLTIGDLAFSKVSIPVVRPSDWLEKGVNTTTGELNNSNLVRVTRFFPIDDTCDYKFTGVIKKEGESENRVRFNYFYDKDKEFIGRSVSTIVENAKFVRFGYGFNSASGITVDDYGFENLIAEWSAEFTPSYIKKENEIEEKLQVLDDNKADVIISTASGSIAHFEDGAEADAVSVIAHIEPVQDLNGYDHPWVGGAGKNKAPMMRDGENKGVTVTVGSDGVVTANGANTSGSAGVIGQSEFVMLNAGSYVLSGSTSVNTGVTIQVLKNVGGAISAITRDSTGGGSGFTLEEDTLVAVRGYISANADVSDLKLYPMIRLASDTDDTYEPYENICPLTGHTEANVSVVGKNYTSKPVVGITINNTTGVISGRPASESTNATTPDLLPITFRDNNIYTLSHNVNANNMLFAYNENKEYMGRTSGNMNNPRIITANLFSSSITGIGGEISYIVVRFYNSNTQILQSDIDKAEIQLEAGSTATEYESYNGQTYNIQFRDGDNPLTVYGGSLNVVSGELVVIDGYIASYNGETLPSTWISDRDVYASGRTPTIGAQVVYELATPITYQLTPQQITTLLGTNNIWADTGDVEVEYRADTKLYIEQLTKPTEDDMTANANIASGKFFMVGNRLFLSTSAIASGDTINPGTNCTELSLADALNNLN